ncbi:Hypothetical predicted protein [Paramuricea clavata]|uniref:Uncharacterized protein n=1 Tax=Paramuricea clavata TaxID=317549 RepID=A0A7D9JVP1_PARCT|nr:Hypothetical predicted protein [Paramuricea clavata]
MQMLLYNQPKCLCLKNNSMVVDARGVIEEGEGKGVAREALTEFWHLFYQSLSVGASAKVSSIRHDYQRQEWKAVARILLYGYCKEGVYPIALSAAFVGCTVLGGVRVSSEVPVKSFMAYIAEDEREVVDNYLKNGSQIDKNEDLLEHSLLLRRIKTHCEKGFNLKILDASPENEAQRNAFDHLVRYIKSLGGNVSAFLQFTTGADIIVEGQKLKVTFTELNGLQR